MELLGNHVLISHTNVPTPVCILFYCLLKLPVTIPGYLVLHDSLTVTVLSLQDCAGVILYCAENATQVALDGIQCLGKY